LAGCAVWDFLADEATPFMAAAVREFGREVLAAEHESATSQNRQAAGRQVLRLVFGAQEFPQVLADVILDPDSERALAAPTPALRTRRLSTPGTCAP
jgi:hypothetical protein